MNIKAALLALAALSSSSFALDLGASTRSTPYDPYLSPVRSVLSDLHGADADLAQVKKLMRTGRSFRYSFTEPYTAQLPAVTAKTKQGDCKAKSLWLADQLGDRNVRYVIGKATSSSKISHAWLMWNDGARWWILDPTNTSRPIPAESVSKNQYIALYSYDANRSYEHAATASFSSVASKGAIASKSNRR